MSLSGLVLNAMIYLRLYICTMLEYSGVVFGTLKFVI